MQIKYTWYFIAYKIHQEWVIKRWRKKKIHKHSQSN